MSTNPPSTQPHAATRTSGARPHDRLIAAACALALALAAILVPAPLRAAAVHVGGGLPAVVASRAPLGISVVMQTDTSLTLDSNNYAAGAGPSATYVQFRFTNNSGSAKTGLQATLSGFAGGIALAGGQPATQYLPALAAGASADLFWFIQYPRTLGVGTTLTVTVSDGSGNTSTGTGRVITRSMISANAGGNLDAQSLRAGMLGAVTWIDATYSFGGVSAGDTYMVQPSGNTTLNAGCFQLVGSQVTASSIPAYPVGARNLLFAAAPANQGGSKIPVTVRWYFRILCTGVGSTAKPYANQQSGASNLKYSGNYDSYGGTQSFPVTAAAMSATKSASRDTLPNGGAIIYTVTITNTSSDPSDSTQVDSIADVLPTGVRFDSLASGSTITAANSMSVPVSGSTGRLVFRSVPGTFYKLYVGTPIVLKYHATVDTTEGSYLNTASSFVGAYTSATANRTVVVRRMIDLAVLKSGLPSDSARVGDTLRFAIATLNRGPSVARSVMVIDSLPSGMSFLAASTGGSATGSVVTWSARDVAIGATLYDTVWVRVSSPSGLVINRAAASSPTYDTLATNNNGSLPGSQVSMTLRARIIAIAVTPDGLGAPARHLPGTATTQSQTFTVTNSSGRSEVFDLLFKRTGATIWLVPDSVKGALLPATTSDSARVTLANATPQTFTVYYRVPAGDSATNNVVLTARSAVDATGLDSGWVNVKRATPIIGLTRGTSAATSSPGTQITYTIQYANVGDYAGVDPVLVESVAAGTQLKLASVANSAPAGIGATTIEYSTNGTTWVSALTSGAGGAPAGFDGDARFIRLSMTGTMGVGASGTLTFVARVK